MAEKVKQEKTKKNDFVEIEFVGKANDDIFDTNIKEKAKKIDPGMKVEPLIVCISKGMVVKGFDKGLEGKEMGKKYKITIPPEEAFGTRNRDLVKTIPMSVFKKQEINPVSGLMLNLDGMVAKILSVSGGRVITDFNNPISGKEVMYEFTIKRKVADEKEKVNALQDFFFKRRFEFSIEDKKILFKKEAAPFLQIFEEKFKEILGKEIVVEEKKEEKKEDKKKEEKSDKEGREEERKEETSKSSEDYATQK